MSLVVIKAAPRRVVVTGIGLVSPVGIGKSNAWKNLIEGKCGSKAITHFDCASFPSKVAASIPYGIKEGEFNSEWINPSIRGSTAPFIHFAVKAADEALKDSKYLQNSEDEKERFGVAIGCGMGSLDDVTKTSEALQSKGYKHVSPYFIPKILPNLAAGHVSIQYGLKGVLHTVSTACATGAHAIGDAFRFIKYGDADMMLAGGTESCITPLSIAGFCRVKALSTSFNDKPTEASRPFDKDRDGFVIAEGAGIVVLEEYQHAIARGAKIYAEVKGYGLSGDAHHITAPDPSDHSGALRAMKAAFREASIPREDVGYVNAHATGTPLGDVVENKAVKQIFGEHAYKLAISSTKGATGHLLGAAGAVEAIFAILALNEGILPPTLNLKNKEPEFDLNYVPLESQKKDLKAALSNSFGFGGTNASLIFTKL